MPVHRSTLSDLPFFLVDNLEVLTPSEERSARQACRRAQRGAKLSNRLSAAQASLQHLLEVARSYKMGLHCLYLQEKLILGMNQEDDHTGGDRHGRRMLFHIRLRLSQQRFIYWTAKGRVYKAIAKCQKIENELAKMR